MTTWTCPCGCGRPVEGEVARLRRRQQGLAFDLPLRAECAERVGRAIAERRERAWRRALLRLQRRRYPEGNGRRAHPRAPED